MSQILLMALGLMLGVNPLMDKIAEVSPRPKSTLAVIQNIEMPEVHRNVLEVREVWITAYSSTPEETDDTPFITASGTSVRDGVLATNLLPFGTEVMIPETFGDKVFTVEDRMHQRKINNVDVWMASRSEALQFGRKYATIVVLE
ncbi:MAG: hypothetical protein Q7R86_02180 [bacterium]|nr:hypothetical protein [bacterium]